MPNSNVLSHSRRIDTEKAFLLRLNTSDHCVKPVEAWESLGPCATIFNRSFACVGVTL